MSAIRKDILAFEPNGIGRVAMEALGEKDVIALWFGEGDLVTPTFIREAAKQALDEGRTFYNYSRGMHELRRAICGYHRRTVGAEVDLERISMPGAAVLAVMTAMQCLVETGDNVVIVSPIWPSIFQAAQTVGAELRFCRLDEDWADGRWRLDLDKLFSLCDAHTKAVFVNSPGNPTGWIATREEQQAILDFTRRHGIATISDEVYGTLVYDGRVHAPSLLEIADENDEIFIINSFSKSWAMTGWRIGWMVHPPALTEAMKVICVANNTGPTVFAQYGALAALTPEGDAFRAVMRERCRAGREVVQDFLDSQNRIRWIRPEGAFYGFLHIDGLTDSLSFALDLVRDGRVGVAPGSAFGPDAANDRFIRICFAQDPERLRQGLDRLAVATAARPAG